MSRATLYAVQRRGTGITTVKVTNATRVLLAELSHRMSPLTRSRFRYSSQPLSVDEIVYQLAAAELDRLDAEGGK